MKHREYPWYALITVTMVAGICWALRDPDQSAVASACLCMALALLGGFAAWFAENVQAAPPEDGETPQPP
jgi:hypothetical protein